MKYINAVTLLFICSISFSQGINFVPEDMKWQDVLAKAKKENKIVFVDAYTTWCGPCKWMAANIFPTKEVGDVFNASFVNAKIDMEKGEGIEISKKYGIRMYPTYLFVNGDGELVHRAFGSKPVDKFIEDAKAAVDPEKQYFSLKKKFDNGDRSPEFLKKMSYAAQDAQEEELQAKASEAYINTQKDWLTKDNMKFIMTFTTSIEGKLFDYLVKNKTAFEKNTSKVEVENIFINLPVNVVFGNFFNNETKILDSKNSELYLSKHLAKELVEQVMAYAAMIEMLQKNDNAGMMKKTVEYMDKYSSENAYFLNQHAWTFFQKANDPVHLQKALEWSLKSVQLDDNYAYNDTAAALYFKIGNKLKAKEYAEKAIKKAKENNEDSAETQALLKKIEAMQ